MDVAHEMTSAGDHPFGLADKKDMAAALRKFADEIEAGAVLPQEVRLIVRAKLEDFVMETLLFRYHRKRPSETKRLYGASSPFPIAEVTERR